MGKVKCNDQFNRLGLYIGESCCNNKQHSLNFISKFISSNFLSKFLSSNFLSKYLFYRSCFREMENWHSFIVKFGGEWDNHSNYIGGEERIAYVPASNICMATLRDNIKYILDVSSIQGVYQIYYLSVSHTSRMMRAILATDVDLQSLCMVNPEPILYLDHGRGHQTVVNPNNRRTFRF